MVAAGFEPANRAFEAYASYLLNEATDLTRRAYALKRERIFQGLDTFEVGLTGLEPVSFPYRIREDFHLGKIRGALHQASHAKLSHCAM